jgi:hypothetical protein
MNGALYQAVQQSDLNELQQAALQPTLRVDGCEPLLLADRSDGGANHWKARQRRCNPPDQAQPPEIASLRLQ